jgi:hypothetical protein
MFLCLEGLGCQRDDGTDDGVRIGASGGSVNAVGFQELGMAIVH